MLPPVDPAVLERNPGFEVLYKDLCARKLNTNASTRETKRQRVHEEIRKALTTARTNLTTTHILTTTLSSLPSKAPNLPPELHACIELATAQLTHPISSSDRAMLSSSIDDFLSHLPTIGAALSSQLCTIASLLCQIADPTIPPPTASLPTRSHELKESATLALPLALQTARLDLTNTATTLLATHRTLLSLSIRILEQTQHGALARHSKSSAELLATRAALLGLQASLHAVAHPPPKEFLDALREWRRGQGSGEKVLREREGLAKRELELYGKAGERGMRELARRKGVLGKERGRVEGEVEALERGGK